MNLSLGLFCNHCGVFRQGPGVCKSLPALNINRLFIAGQMFNNTPLIAGGEVAVGLSHCMSIQYNQGAPA